MSTRICIHPSSVVLVSGGARGITAHCVVKLAQRVGCKFILVGRSSLDEPLPSVPAEVKDESAIKRLIANDLQARGEKPTPVRVQKLYHALQSRREIQHTLQAVEAAGGKAEYISADISDGPALKQKLIDPVRRLGPVTGVIHAAGSLADKLIEKKSEKDFDTVYSPKVTGLESLMECIPASQLDFLVLFSSIVGFYGNVGQSDYAVANEILNKYAYLIKHNHPDCRVISINWGPWDGGMVTPELKRMFLEKNVEIIPLEVGANILVEELAPYNGVNVQVVVGTPPTRPVEALDAEMRTYQIRRKLLLEANPFLYDHCIGEYAVLPATCAATWVVNACEQLYPGYQFLKLEHFKILKGIVFDETLADEYVLDLKETAKNASGEVSFKAMIWSTSPRGKTLYHYSLNVTLKASVPHTVMLRNAPEASVEVSEENLLLPDAGLMDGKVLYENGTLFHGPSFQGVEQVLHVSHGKLVMRCVLPKIDENHQGQFPVQTSNPFIYDVIVQCLLIWSKHFYQAPCLPSRLACLEQYREIPFGTPCIVHMDIQSQTETSVVANILVEDIHGKVYVRFTGLEGIISRHLANVIGSRSAHG
jgi:NAD(P)-dependent dehydrogenase (short-subunit alcohol dehydrogenase family)